MHHVLLENKVPRDLVDVITQMDFILTPQRTRHMTGAMLCVEFKHGYLLTDSPEEDELVIWNTETSTQMTRCKTPYAAESLCVLPNEQFLICYFRPSGLHDFYRSAEIRDQNLILLRTFHLDTAYTKCIGLYHDRPIIRTINDMFASIDIKTGECTDLFRTPSEIVLFKVYNNDTIFTMTKQGECIVYRNDVVVYHESYYGYQNIWNDDTHWIQFNKDEFKVWNHDTLRFDRVVPVPRLPLDSGEEHLRNVHRVAGGFIIVIVSKVYKKYALLYYVNANTQKSRLWKLLKTQDHRFHDTSLLSNGMFVTLDTSRYPHISHNHGMHCLADCIS